MISLLTILFRKTRWLFLFFIISFTTTSIVWAGYHRGQIFSVPYAVLKRVTDSVKSVKKTSSCACTWSTMPFAKKNYYRLHRKAGAHLTDSELISNFEHQLELQSKEVLVSIGDSKGYIVQSMHYGSPVLHKDALKMLTEIEKRFLQKQVENNLPRAQFVISSAARTAEQQKQLSKKNRNATKGVSSHSYGASIDIPRIVGKKCKENRALLQLVLEEMQKENKVYLTPESVTIHVTAR